MNSMLSLGIIIGAVTGVSIAIMVLFPFLKKKGINTEEIIKDANLASNAIEGVAAVSTAVAPNSPAANILNLIKDWAKEGVHQAEQLYIVSKLDKDERNAQAKESIYAVLNMLKIKRTDDIDKLIDTVIDAECLAMGHKSKSEAEQQAEKEQLQTQVQQLQSENKQLQNTISTIHNTVQVSVK